jgi:crotonobetainyl-CoA:carnitine CoA-transferase CaiB-like acyl-CoA transferase
MINTFFKDLKVVELASVLAGPAVGLFFAELGAEVIKVENKTTGGDVTRRWKGPKEAADAPLSAYYCSVNWNKKAMLLDLRDTDDRAAVLSLIDTADVVISNFKSASAQKMGLDYATLKSRNPRLIYAQLDAFESGNPRPAFDIVLQAEAGFLFMSGEPGRSPVRMPVALIDLLAAHQLKEGILVALLHRERSGKGGLVRTSLLEAAIASLANQATNWLMAGHIPQPMGTAHPNIAPYGDVFYTKDQKPLVIAVGTERHFQQLCACLGQPELGLDPAFATNAARVKNREALTGTLAPAFLQKTRTEWIAMLTAHGVPAGSIRNMEEVFELPTAQKMILEELTAGGFLTKRVQTVSFTITE